MEWWGWWICEDWVVLGRWSKKQQHEWAQCGESIRLKKKKFKVSRWQTNGEGVLLCRWIDVTGRCEQLISQLTAPWIMTANYEGVCVTEGNDRTAREIKKKKKKMSDLLLIIAGRQCFHSVCHVCRHEGTRNQGAEENELQGQLFVCLLLQSLSFKLCED